ncbi:MAG: YiiD C-terminal domain-containing protein [Bacteroidales bacterium]|nr:YiiD C-terminal domain-containing protein [Bacteroidales bacterium]MBN2757089.1 YiiD C-terminal domain-containing protein [Bacteroidales bacterium]
MKHFDTKKKESLKTKFLRIGLNFFPAYRGTGARAIFVSDDWKEVHIKLRLNWRTRNYVGTVFGGSMYSAVDPIYMIQLIKLLGENYIVWDKSAIIKFLKPVKKTVYAKFLIDDSVLDEIRKEVANQRKCDIEIPVEYVDNEGIVYAVISKILFIAEKDYYKNKKLRDNKTIKNAD